MVILIWAFLFWVGLFALIKWLELRSGGRISRWLQARNMSLYLGYVSWTTTRFNTSLTKISQKYRRWWDLWFSLGVTFGLVGLIFSVIILVGNLGITLTHVWFALMQSNGRLSPTSSRVSARSLTQANAVDLSSNQSLDTLSNSIAASSTTEKYVDIEFVEKMHRAEETMKHVSDDITKSRGILTPLLPGINLPKSQLGYILFALLVSALFHELGHALAAGAEELHVNGVGGFLALIFPGAYVQIEGVDRLPPWRQLKVYCAGAWHNIAVALSCVIAIAFLPMFLFPFFTYHHGAVVTVVPSTSVLRQHVFPGDVIKAVNSQHFSDRNKFVETLRAFQSSADGGSFGFCFGSALLEKSAKDGSECCGSERNSTVAQKFQCFSNRQPNEKKICLQPGMASLQKSCSGEDCSPGPHDRNGSSCYYPVLPEGQQLLDVLVVDGRTELERHVIFQGMPATLEKSIVLSNYLPRFSVLFSPFPELYELIVGVDFPKKLDRLFQYTFSVSLCLAVLNMAPVFFLDGEASAILFVRIFRPRMGEWMRQRVKSVMLMAGTMLLAGNIVLSLAVINL